MIQAITTYDRVIHIIGTCNHKNWRFNSKAFVLSWALPCHLGADTMFTDIQGNISVHDHKIKR